jgi:hypothetical protein
MKSPCIGCRAFCQGSLRFALFSEKSPDGIRTAQSDIALIHERLKLAQQHYKDHYDPSS